MYKVNSLSSPQLVICEQSGVVVALSTKQIISLYKKSEQSDIPFDVLREVYQRGYRDSLSEQVAFNRVNSFIAGGAAIKLDVDLVENYTGAEKVSKNSDDASSRFIGTDSLTAVYKKATPGYTKTIKRVAKQYKYNK